MTTVAGIQDGTIESSRNLDVPNTAKSSQDLAAVAIGSLLLLKSTSSSS
jgi:hypothetical protein